MNAIINTTIDFNNDLMKAVCESDSEDEENRCLISGEPLEPEPIQLGCRHKFNYDAILNEIKMQKKHSPLEVTRLKSYQIKCPYCRYIQSGVLPWRENYPQLNGINWPMKKTYKAFICPSILKSGKCKGGPCGKRSIKKYCPRHLKMMKKSKDKLMAIVEVSKVAPTPVETTDTGATPIPTSHSGCLGILKRGKRKGYRCGAAVKFHLPSPPLGSILPNMVSAAGTGYCGRHHKMWKNKATSLTTNLVVNTEPLIETYHPNTGMDPTGGVAAVSNKNFITASESINV